MTDWISLLIWWPLGGFLTLVICVVGGNGILLSNKGRQSGPTEPLLFWLLLLEGPIGLLVLGILGFIAAIGWFFCEEGGPLRFLR